MGGDAQQVVASAEAASDPQPTSSTQHVAVQQLVKEFTQMAVAGVKCTYVDFQSGGQCSAVYSLDPTVSNFTVMLDNDMGSFSCSLPHILDMSLYQELHAQLPAMQHFAVSD